MHVSQFENQLKAVRSMCPKFLQFGLMSLNAFAMLGYLCCLAEQDRKLSDYLPASHVLHPADGMEALLLHPQIVRLTSEELARLGCAKTPGAIQAFWHWYRYACENGFCDPFPELPMSSDHALDALELLPLLGSVRCTSLGDRKRALCSREGDELNEGLVACQVVLVPDWLPCPSVSCPNSVARAVAWALNMREPELQDATGARPVLEKLAHASVREACEAAKKLPLFRYWNGTLGYPLKPLSPPLPEGIRRELEGIKLDILDERCAVITDLLVRMKVRTASMLDIAEEAVLQRQHPSFIAQLLRENLGSVLKGKPVLPVQGSMSSDGVCLKAPEECLLWDCELGFSHIPRRISASEGEVFSDLQGRLVELGCRTELTEADVLDVASQVEKEQDEGLALKLLSRLEKHPHMTQICKGTSLRRIAWLPCSVQAERVLMAPEKCPWQRGALQLVGKVRPIVSVQANPDLLAALGVLGPDAVEDGVLHEQLAALIQDDSAADDVTPVYRKLKSVPSLEKWVWTRHGFQALGRVSKDPDVQALAPVLQVLRDEWHDLPAFRAVNSKLTPQELFLAMDLAAPMHNITAEDAHQVHMAAIRLLTKYRDADGSYPNLAELARAAGSELRVPGKHSMVPVAKTFFQDMRWHSTSPPAGMEEVHGGMSRDDCARLGVPNLSEILAKECSCADEDWLEVTGQHEPLTRRLKNILKDYPWQALVKEMLQNAEDAGAGRFKVLIDRRSRGTESLLTPEMADQQGPCIWFYNDAVFEDKDFQALVSLGQGSKAGEKGKIGRHGLGFNAIFNITDVPSILSREHLGRNRGFCIYSICKGRSQQTSCEAEALADVLDHTEDLRAPLRSLIYLGSVGSVEHVSSGRIEEILVSDLSSPATTPPCI